MSKKIFNILCIVFIPFQLSSTAYKIQDNVYAGKSQNKNGETVYFGMELVTQANMEKWELFKRQTDFNSSVNISLASICATMSDPNDRLPPSADRIDVATGFTEIELRDYHEFLYRKGFYNKEKYHIFSSIYEALKDFRLESDQRHYVVYASKKEVKGSYNFLDQELERPSQLGVKQYEENYGDLLMVSLLIDDTDSPLFASSCIFRTPKSYVERGYPGYKGISMLLYGFSAAVFKEIEAKKIKSKKHMCVPGLISGLDDSDEQSAMQKIIIDHCKEGELFIGSNETLLNDLNPQFPSRIHVSEGKTRILKENVNLAAYKDIDPPKEDVEYESSSINLSDLGDFKVPNLIKVEALINLYQLSTNTLFTEAIDYIKSKDINDLMHPMTTDVVITRGT